MSDETQQSPTLEERRKRFLDGYNTLVALTGFEFQAGACMVIDRSIRVTQFTTIDNKNVEIYIEMPVVPVANWTDPTVNTQEKDTQVLDKTVPIRKANKQAKPIDK